MAKKKNNNNNNNKSQGTQNDNGNQNQNQNPNQNEEKNKKKGESESTPTTVVLNVDMHCKGCASRIVKCLHGFQALKLNLLLEGVEKVKAESELGKLTITGNVDPMKLRDKLAGKMKKQVELISPLPKKENKPQNQNKNNDDKKPPKEAPVTTAVLKVELHCQGCIERIRKTVSKTKGVLHVAIDKEKETVTVKGTMDVKALVGHLSERLRKKVVVVPPKNEKEKGKEKKDNENEGGAGEGKKKQKGGEGGGENEKVEDGKGKVDQQNKMEVAGAAHGYGYGFGYGYEPVYIEQLYVPAPQMFSDENPNACSVM